MDNSFIPRPFGVTDARNRVDELARKQQALDGANRNSSSTIPPGGTLRVEGGVLVPGGQISVTGGGNISTTADGIDRYTNQPIKVSTSLGNREVIEPWTGLPVLRPGIWLANTSYQTDPANMASLTSRYGDNIEIQSLNYTDSEGRRWRSAANIDPAGASLYWSRQDGDPASPSTGGTSQSGGLSVSLDSALSVATYVRNAAPDDPAVIHTNTALSMRPWGGQMGPPDGLQIRYEQSDYNGTYINKGLFKFDKDGLMTLHSEKGANKVDVIHTGDGVLTLKGSNSVNVVGTFTVNGSPVGGAVTSVAGRTGDVVLAGTDIPAATTSAPGAMSAADKAKLNGLGTESIVSALSPAGWNVGGSIFVEPLAGETKITIALVPKYTGANVTITTTAYTSMGTVLPSAAMSSTADSPYVLTQVVGAGLNNQAIAFVNLATGAASIRAVGANFTLASGALFTISYTYKR
ncbi:hypothetical protein [Arthrobacter woluwensis]|uniref:hypothetical protein n=1 Tax=Arthrobacter woluwensis TaxID=156980 RepID=UPI0008257065|nr:hypothetical protein [Arthrobacter woluwensis]